MSLFEKDLAIVIQVTVEEVDATRAASYERIMLSVKLGPRDNSITIDDLMKIAKAAKEEALAVIKP